MQDSARHPTDTPAASGHWPQIAAWWSQVGPPLRPSQADLDALVGALGLDVGDRPPLSVLILGVTPELYRLPWPAGSTIRASDQTQAMIDALWPGPRTAVVRENWLEMAWPAASFDVVLCDGGLHLLRYPNEQQRLATVLARLLRPGGLMTWRLFALPEVSEAPDAVLDHLLEGGIPNLNVLKLRLGMALQASSTAGVALRDVWGHLQARHPDREALADRLGWTRAHLLAIDSYRDSPSRYHFAARQDSIELLCGPSSAFTVKTVHTPSYPLGERCPTVVFERAR